MNIKHPQISMFAFLLFLMLDLKVASAQVAGDASCPMCGMMTGPLEWLSSVLGVATVGAFIAVLIALVVFLIRRSRGGPGRV